jgi:hypothetical protein
MNQLTVAELEQLAKNPGTSTEDKGEDTKATLIDEILNVRATNIRATYNKRAHEWRENG